MQSVAIIGGGASGVTLASLLASRTIEENYLDVHLFEAGDDVLRKVAATGNGRCNFTNNDISPDYYTGGTDNFVKCIISDFSTEEAISFFRDLGVESVSKESGRIYPKTLMAKTVVDALKNFLYHSEVIVNLNSKIVDISINEDDKWYLKVEKQEADIFSGPFDYVIIATGGSYGIKKDEWSNGYSLVKSFGHEIKPLYPGITALNVEEKEFCKKLKGVKQRVAVSGMGKRMIDDILFTETGISGIAVFKISNYYLYEIRKHEIETDYHDSDYEIPIEIDFLPDNSAKNYAILWNNVAEIHPDWTVLEIISGAIYREIASSILLKLNIDESRKGAIISSKCFYKIAEAAKCVELNVLGANKHSHGQITCGGLSTEYIDAETLESKKVKTLFFTGEVLNVQGECGGYNLHWAWASAHCVAKSIAKYLGGNDVSY